MKKMPKRTAADGEVVISRLPDDRIEIKVEDNGKMRRVVMSDHNAWRVFGMMSVFLGIPLSDKVGKAITL